MIDTISEMASLPQIGASDITAHLKLITANLRTGKVRSGVIGLTKAGKSTILNALLGTYFLPSTIQPQTAKEVRIIHTPSSPQGALYAIREKGDIPELIASGREEISEHLTQLNKNVRGNKTMYRELTLQAPFQFLAAEKVKLEVSDTPGFFEAAAKNITSESELAVKDMCAFILILNVQLLKTQSESELLNLLVQHHPRLFSKLNRVLILINALDVAYFDDSKGSLKPDEIPEYVSKYLADPQILNLTIAPQHIIPMSAKWALRSRVWSANPASFLKSEDAKNQYKEALILLRRAGYEQETKPLEEMTEENVLKVSSHLATLSQIETIETKLREMLYKYGPAVILEAAVDVTLAEIQNLEGLISQKIKEENLEKKQDLVLKHDQLLVKLREAKLRHLQSAQQLATIIRSAVTSQVNTVTESLRQAIDGQIGTILMNHLNGFHNKDDRQLVYSRICSVKSVIVGPAQHERESSWNSIANAIRNSQVQQTRDALSQLKAELVSVLQVDPNTATDFPSFAKLASELSSQVTASLDLVDPNTLVPSFHSLSQGVSADSIPDSKLNLISQKAETRWRTESRSKKKKSGFLGLGRKRVTWYESVPYQVTVYSPDITAIKNVFTAEATNPWTQGFRRRVDEVVSQTSNQLVDAANNAMTSTLSKAERSLQSSIDSSKEVEQRSRTTVEKLIGNKHELEVAKTKLVTFDHVGV